MTETGVKVAYLRAKEHQVFLATTRCQERGLQQTLPQNLPQNRRNEPCRQLDFGLVASTAVREYISVVLRHPAGAGLFWRRRKLMETVTSNFMWFIVR